MMSAILENINSCYFPHSSNFKCKQFFVNSFLLQLTLYSVESQNAKGTIFSLLTIYIYSLFQIAKVCLSLAKIKKIFLLILQNTVKHFSNNINSSSRLLSFTCYLFNNLFHSDRKAKGKMEREGEGKRIKYVI